MHKDIGKSDIGTWREVENQPRTHRGIAWRTYKCKVTRPIGDIILDLGSNWYAPQVPMCQPCLQNYTN